MVTTPCLKKTPRMPSGEGEGVFPNTRERYSTSCPSETSQHPPSRKQIYLGGHCRQVPAKIRPQTAFTATAAAILGTGNVRRASFTFLRLLPFICFGIPLPAYKS